MNQAAIQHFDALSRMLGELGPHAIELLEHQYRPQDSGAFELVFGCRLERLKFIWNGRESLLSVSAATLPDREAVPLWIHDADIRIPQRDKLYAEMASRAIRRLTQ